MAFGFAQRCFRFLALFFLLGKFHREGNVSRHFIEQAQFCMIEEIGFVNSEVEKAAQFPRNF